ncbi:hypothetical protein [Paenibacillus lutimineralis]|uniref:hypothetical protein n=1 Tax=Paenibacillus lutimineralis TaxID=2707005 RepID=UPI001D04DB86|nr:hypothetical protein [Paenibacillus lutimineralis]
MRHGSFGSVTFRKIFLSYTVILIIPIIVFSSLNVQRNIMEERQRLHDKHISDANRIAVVVDDKLQELKNLGKLMSEESWVRKMMQNTDVYENEFDFLKMLEIRRNFENSINSLNILSFGMIVFSRKRTDLFCLGDLCGG